MKYIIKTNKKQNKHKDYEPKKKLKNNTDTEEYHLLTQKFYKNTKPETIICTQMICIV